MPEDSFQEVTTESWFSRIGGAIKGILFGLVLFVVAFPLLFWNEGRAVKRYKTLKEGAGQVISVSAEKVDSSNSGKLVHMSGLASTKDTLSDPVFGVSATAIKLERTVEMYQWKETKTTTKQKKVGGSQKTVTDYKYSQVWSDDAIDSSKFKKSAEHRNPGTMPYESEDWTAKNVSLGAFKLSSSLVSKLNDFTPLTLDSDTPVPEQIAANGKIHNGGFYIGTNPAAPQTGDLRIMFKTVEPMDVSIVSEQQGDTFQPFQAEAGGTINLLETGTLTANAMFQSAHQSNKMLTWVLRIAGFLLMLIGLNLIFKPMSVLADVLPILGDIVGAGTGIIAFLVSAVLSLITIAIAWVFYRPLLGIALIVIAIGLAVAVKMKLKKAPQPAPAESPAS